MKLNAEDRRLEAKRVKNMLADALDELAGKIGCEQLRIYGGDYEFSPQGNLRLKVEVVLDGGLSREADRYENWRGLESFELPPLGSELSMKPNGPLHTVVGINTTATKIIVEDHTGKRIPIARETAKALVIIHEGTKNARTEVKDG